jgi:response regulator RpfG family c-di-GMP phosphodiesterase
VQTTRISVDDSTTPPRAPKPGKPLVLCVDDEPHILAGLRLQLRRVCQVVVAENGPAALVHLEGPRSFAAVISDMRMPGMLGSEFLTRALEICPDTTRMLLTGQADLKSTVIAVNDGQIFRFLTKPCSPAALQEATRAAIRQHELVTAEKVLLRETLTGSVRALSDVLSLTNPVAFGRALRIRRLCEALAVSLGPEQRWVVEVAAVFGQLGAITLPTSVVRKAEQGYRLSSEESEMVARAPGMVRTIVGSIPRLDGVQRLIDEAAGDATEVSLEAQVIRLATEFDLMETRGTPAIQALGRIRTAARHDAKLIGALCLTVSRRSRESSVVRVPVHSLAVGMTLSSDLLTMSERLLMTRGTELTATSLVRVLNYRDKLPPTVEIFNRND